MAGPNGGDVAMDSAASPSPKQRLIITDMHLENFKSYAGFFSSIVGPNGSGKSNVIDALLFVFGFKASRIRLKRLSELVHSSAAQPNITQARVTVFFADILDLPGEEYEIVQGTQFSISRTADLDNNSKYFIGDRKSTFGEVTDWLRTKGIDLDHNRFLILQGEVEAISLMPPKAKNEHETGMLEYLEDIIGTGKYKEPIEDAAKAVSDLTDARDSQLQLVKSSLKDREALAGAKTEAESYIRMEYDMLRAESIQAQLSIKSREERKQACSERLEDVRKTFQTVSKEYETAFDESKKAEQQYSRYKKDVEVKEAAVKRTYDDAAKFERKKTELLETQKGLTKQLKKAQDTLRKEELSLKTAQQNLLAAKTDLAKAEKDLIAAEPSLQKVTAELEAMDKTLQHQLEPLRVSLEAKKRECLPFKNKLSQNEGELKLATEQLNILAAKFEQAKKRLESERTAWQAAKEEVERLTAQVDSQSKEQLRVTKDQESAKKRMQAIQQERTAASDRLRALTSKIEEQRSAQHQAQSTNQVVNFLEERKRKGLLPGFHGRLGDLGAINAKFDVAISTACGALNNIVVDDVPSGEKCMELLRQHNVGRTTAIVLSKQTNFARQASSTIQAPPGTQRLFDLVEIPNDAHRVAFYFGLRDTLVADNLDIATKIAYGPERWRVVTLQGHLIEPSGTMSGGGRPQSGLMRSKNWVDTDSPSPLKPSNRERQVIALQKKCTNFQVRVAPEEVDPKVMAQMENEIQDLRRKIGALNSEEDELSRTLHERQTEADRLASEIATAKMNLQGKKEAIREFEKRIAQLEKELNAQQQASQSKQDPDAAQRAQLQNTIETLTAKRETIQNSMKDLQDEVEALEKQMKDVGGLPRQTLDYQARALSDQVGELKKNISKHKVTITSTEKEIQKTETKVSNGKKEVSKLERDTNSSQDRLDSMEKELIQLKDLYEKAKLAAHQTTDSSDELREQVTELKKVAAEKQAKQAEYQNKVKEHEKEVRQLETELALLNKHIDEFDQDILKSIAQYGSDVVTGGQRVADAEDDTQTQAEGTQRGQGGRPAKRRRLEGGAESAGGGSGEFKTTRLPAQELAKFDIEKVRYDISQTKESLSKMKPNLQVLAEYRERERDYTEKAKKLELITQDRADRIRHHEGLKKQRLSEFMHGFTSITLKLKEMYRMLSLGGDADLELVDSLDPFAEGIVFSVRPNKKSWKVIANLSGGEKTLSSLSLVFALHHYRPSPLYVLDEIDAALDFTNVSLVANYIKGNAVDAQFIVISLRNNMFELANRLVGIYKTQDCTKSVTINPQYFQIAAAGGVS